MECSDGSPKTEAYCNTGLPQEARKVSNIQPNLTPNELQKEQQIKPKASRRREIIKTKMEITDTETNKQKMGACVAQLVEHPTLDLSSGLISAL